jgi:acyl phosphate:glycerol-3-phosphate acyltransferase
VITPTNIYLLILAYLMGSIPSAVWIGKYFYKTDVREYGSGNAGATNVFRVLGKKAGIPVLLLDVLKGFGGGCLAVFSSYSRGSTQFTNLELVLGMAALVGHIFPIFAQFRGGKGIATLLGIIMGVHLFAGLISIAVFTTVLLISNYVSLASILSSIFFPIIVLIIGKIVTPTATHLSMIPAFTKPLLIFSILIPIMVIITHQKNIERLLRKEESKSKLIKKKVKKKEPAEVELD